MAEQDDQQQTPLKPPPETDRNWQEKIETAKKAREMGQEQRKDKESSFRRAVGRAGSSHR